MLRWGKWEGWVTKGHEETFGSDGYVYCPDCGDGFTGETCQNIRFYTLNMGR